MITNIRQNAVKTFIITREDLVKKKKKSHGFTTVTQMALAVPHTHMCLLPKCDLFSHSHFVFISLKERRVLKVFSLGSEEVHIVFSFCGYTVLQHLTSRVTEQSIHGILQINVHECVPKKLYL